MPIDTMYGMVYQNAGFYIRRSHKGKLYNCRCPDRSKHIKTPVEAMVRARKNDLSHMSEDQVNFFEQKNRADGKKTMKAYLWSICGAEYDQQHG